MISVTRVVDFCFFFSSRRRHTRLQGDWSSDVCSSDLRPPVFAPRLVYRPRPVYYAPAPVYYAPPASAYYPAPAPVYYQQPWGTLGGAIAGAAIGGAVGDGRPGAIAAGSVIGAVIGNGLSR